MELKKVYVETTIPSAFASRRTDPGSRYRRDVTRRWWLWERERYDLWTSAATIDELSAGSYPGQSEATAIVRPLPLLPMTDDVHALAQLYI